MNMNWKDKSSHFKTEKYNKQHRRNALIYQQRHREAGLCHFCSQKVAEKVIYQDGKEMFRKKLCSCVKHIDYQKKRDRRKV